jgi:hypothetical protein
LKNRNGAFLVGLTIVLILLLNPAKGFAEAPQADNPGLVSTSADENDLTQTEKMDILKNKFRQFLGEGITTRHNLSLNTLFFFCGTMFYITILYFLFIGIFRVFIIMIERLFNVTINEPVYRGSPVLISSKWLVVATAILLFMPIFATNLIDRETVKLVLLAIAVMTTLIWFAYEHGRYLAFGYTDFVDVASNALDTLNIEHNTVEASTVLLITPSLRINIPHSYFCSMYANNSNNRSSFWNDNSKLYKDIITEIKARSKKEILEIRVNHYVILAIIAVIFLYTLLVFI